MINDQPYPFAAYTKYAIKQISKLEKLKLPNPILWEIDWTMLHQINSQTKKKYTQIDLFEKLRSRNSLPAIYQFDIDPMRCKELHKVYGDLKADSSRIKRETGVRTKGFKNICYVPKVCNQTASLYVGSVIHRLSTRLQNHLGLGGSGRTGSLYLYHLSQFFNEPPPVVFKAYFFDKQFAPLIEHIELVFQETLNPLLGKRSLRLLNNPAGASSI